jgi:hypothetical protein
MAVIVVPRYEPTRLARWAYRSLLERLAAATDDELRLELRRTPGDDPRDLGFADALAELEMRLHDLYEVE